LSIAKKYLKMWSSAGLEFPISEWELLWQIKLAKNWSVVEFLYNNADIIMLIHWMQMLFRKFYQD